MRREILKEPPLYPSRPLFLLFCLKNWIKKILEHKKVGSKRNLLILDDGGLMIRLSRQTFWSKSRDAILSLFQLITTGSFPFKKKLDYNKCPVTRFYHINFWGSGHFNFLFGSLYEISWYGVVHSI